MINTDNPHFDTYRNVSTLHNEVFNASEPLIRHHWAKALKVESLDRSNHLETEHPLNLDLDDDDMMNHFRLACLFDTMRRTADETQGGDDSTYDYAPDGGMQIQMLLDVETFDHVIRTMIDLRMFDDDSFSTQDKTEALAKATRYEIYFMDCTSPLLIETIYRMSL